MKISQHIINNEFGLDCKGNEVQSNDPIENLISAISPGTPRTELPDKLTPILRLLAAPGFSEAKADAYLNGSIKEYFSLSTRELKAYQADLRDRRKAARQQPKSSEENSSPEYSARFDSLVDLVEHEGRTAYLIKDDGQLRILEQYQKDGKIYIPPPMEQIPWLLPSGERIINIAKENAARPREEVDRRLYGDLADYHMGISELPSNEYYDLLAAWDMHTYLPENVQYTPIIWFYAVPERGKSRTGKGLIYVCYRGLHVESMRDAYLIRVATNFGASLFFDVMDIWRKAEKSGNEDILLGRFERGMTIARVIYPEKGPFQDTVYYEIFGPSIIGTNKTVHPILVTRAIQINMPMTARNFEVDVTPEKALPFKERLIAFRARHMGRPLPNISKPALGRLGDILKPLAQIVNLVAPAKEDEFMALIEKLQLNRLAEKAETLEARILLAITSLQGEVDGGILSIKRITEIVNEGRSDNEIINSRSVGRKTSALGFEKVKRGDGSAIVWNDELLERINSSYGLSKTSQTSLTSQLPF